MFRELREADRIRFRCHTGYAFSADALLAELTDGIGASMWNTVRSIEESVMLMKHLARHLEFQNGSLAQKFSAKAEEAQRRADVIRQTLFDHEELSTKKVAAAD